MQVTIYFANQAIYPARTILHILTKTLHILTCNIFLTLRNQLALISHSSRSEQAVKEVTQLSY